MKRINKIVFVPSIIILGGAAILGLVDGERFGEISHGAFSFILSSFGWLFQIAVMASVFVVLFLFISKGKIRFGGKNAKPKFSFMSWFAMSLTGGIATGLVLYGVNEPIVYVGNVYGEMSHYGIATGTTESAIFAMGRVFYNWTFLPYATYALAGALMAYLYFNKGTKLAVSETLRPIVGKLADNNYFNSIVNTLSLLAIALGLASSLGGGLTFVGSAIEFKYGISQGYVLWGVIAAVITIIFTFASYKGVEKGIKILADFNTRMYFLILLILFIVGPTIYMLSLSSTGMGYWLDNFFSWGLDSGNVFSAKEMTAGLDASLGGDALVQWWTLYDWAMWIAYAPLMSIFLAMIAYGRTIREFLIVNWILPATFGVVWFTIWGATAIYWQNTGEVDLVSVINEGGALAAMWAFVDNINIAGFNIGMIIIPIMIICLIVSFATAADAMTTSIATLCSKDLKQGEEPSSFLKIIWGVIIGAIAFVLVASVGGDQGVDGVKYMAAVGGGFVLIIFLVQIISAIKTFFMEELTEPEEPLMHNE
ncbi:MAG: BCCT family transporter [Bacilli bacterium]